MLSLEIDINAILPIHMICNVIIELLQRPYPTWLYQ